MRRSLAALWLIALVSTAAAEEFELPALRGSSPYVPAPPVYTRWGGFYGGGDVGFTPATLNFTGGVRPLVAQVLRFTKVQNEVGVSSWPSLPTATSRGASFGAFAGYNSQWDEIVVGVEANYTHVTEAGAAASSVTRTPVLSDLFAYTVTVNTAASMQLHEFATLRARGGYAMGLFLPYLTGGLAVGRIDYFKTASASYPTPVYTVAVTPPDLPPPPPPSFATQTATEIKKNALAFGYAIGAGMDVALMPNLFLRGEYEFVGLPISHMQISLHNFRAGAGLKF